MKRSFKTWLLVAFSVLCLGCATTGVCTYDSVSAQTSENAFQMVDGASIRVHGNIDAYGIRFAATHSEYDAQTNYQMMVLPAEYVAQYDKDTAADKENIVAWMLEKKVTYETNNVGKTFPLAIVDKCLYDEDKGYIYGSIVDIMYQNLNRDFCAYVYYQDGGDYIIAGEASSEEEKYRSITDVAINALTSGDYDGQDKAAEKANLESIVASSIKQSQGLAQDAQVSIVLNETSLTKLRGEKAQLTYEGIGAELIQYKSENENVCTVDENGWVTFVNVGETKITASVCGVETTVDVVSTVPEYEVLSFDCESDINNIKAWGGDGASVEYLNTFEGENGVIKLTYNNQWPFMQFKPLRKMADYADYDEIIFRMYFPKDTTNNQYVKAWKIQKNNAIVASAKNIPGNFNGDQLNTWIDIVYDAQTFIELWTDDMQLINSGNVPNLGGTANTGAVGGEYYISDISVRKYIDGEVLSFDHRMDLDKVSGLPSVATKTWLNEFAGETGVMKIEHSAAAYPQFTFKTNLAQSAYEGKSKIIMRMYVPKDDIDNVYPLTNIVLGNSSDASENCSINFSRADQYNTWINVEFTNIDTFIKYWFTSPSTSIGKVWSNGTKGPNCFYIAAIWVE